MPVYNANALNIARLLSPILRSFNVSNVPKLTTYDGFICLYLQDVWFVWVMGVGK